MSSGPGPAGSGAGPGGDEAWVTLPGFDAEALDPADAADNWRVVARAAQENPLSHPLAFSLAEMRYETPPGPHLVEMYHAIYRGLTDPQAPKRIQRIIPRYHAKSEGCSVVMPSWRAIANPNSRTLLISESSSLAKGKLGQCREIIERVGPRYGVQIAEAKSDRLTLERSATHDVPTIRAAGMTTSITGEHYDTIVFDDIVSWESQRTEAQRELRWKQFQDYLNLGAGDETVYVMIGTRKHVEDLYGKVLGNPMWDSRVEPAIYDWSVVENGEYTLITDTGAEYPAEAFADLPADETPVDVRPHRDVPVLWPAHLDLSDLILKYLTAGSGELGSSLVWQRENQNDPQVMTGRILAEDMLRFTDSPHGDLTRDDLIYHAGVDLGVEKDPEKAAMDDTDYWAVAVVGFSPGGYPAYLDKVARRRGMSMQQGVEWVGDTLLDYDHTPLVHVESNQAQVWFVQGLEDEGVYVEESTSTGDKEDRIITMSGRFESGKVRILDDGEGQGPQWRAFASEWVQFPTGSHDDMLDATEIAMRGKADEEEEKVNASASPFVF